MAGVHDMLRYNAMGKFKSWEPDYGCIEDADEFQAMLAYSPVHNVAPGTAYPAMLIVTGANDDRVVPMNSYKLLAALQAAQTSDKPILGYIEMQSGHGIGTDTVDMQIRQCVTFWSFLASVLGMTVQHPREGSKDAD
jgi:prolyl oligopeptidase